MQIKDKRSRLSRNGPPMQTPEKTGLWETIKPTLGVPSAGLLPTARRRIQIEGYEETMPPVWGIYFRPEELPDRDVEVVARMRNRGN